VEALEVLARVLVRACECVGHALFELLLGGACAESRYSEGSVVLIPLSGNEGARASGGADDYPIFSRMAVPVPRDVVD
jgi:hypothetical protein